MSEQTTPPESKLTDPQTEVPQSEVEAQAGEEIPDREAMSLVNANLALPINAAVAANVLSDNSTALADAKQTGVFDQTAG